METINIKGNWTALTPIHHGANDTYGTVKVIHSQPTIVKNSLTGEFEVDEVPCIHGNAIRGMLRRLIMDDFLTQLDYTLDSTKLYHFLFNGGILESIDPKDKGAINLKKKLDIRTHLPPVSVFGSALGNQMIHGKLKVGMGEIVCSETAHYLSDYTDAGFSAYNLKATDFGTRVDDLEDKLEQETEETTQDDSKNKDEQKTQMIYEFESLIKGTKFTHEFLLEDMLPHEQGCFKRAIELWEERPYVGGMSGTGYGKIQFNYNGLEQLDSNTYLDYLVDNKEEITAFIDGLAKIWK